MSKENLNNIPNWKAKLDALDDLPGDNTYVKNDAWEKLHARLGNNKRSTNKAWYWIAAACIFFTLLIPLFYSNSNNHQATNVSLDKPQPSIKAPSGDKSNTSPVTNLSVVNNERKPPVTIFKTREKIIHEKEKLRLSYAVSSKILIPQTNSDLMTPLDTLSSLTIVKPENKKLKVVHINELGDPAETLPEVVKNSDRHIFQFKIGSQETYINPTTASNTNSFTILKIKTSQN